MYIWTSRVFTFLAWSLIIALSVYFFMDNVLAYFYGYRSRVFGDSFFHNQVWVVSHMAGGTLTLFIGPLQFSKYLRTRYVKVHRALGKWYMFGVALAGMSALRLSLISTCVPCRVSLFLLAVFALLSTAFAWKAIKMGNIKAHRQFMVRSYISILAFVAVRIDDIFPLDFLFGNISDPLTRRIINEYFWSFVPLLIGEIIMVWVPSVYPVRRKASRA
ncbi:MAG: DUF2306 domain-containing protein [Flavisolibacter sp.]